MFSFSTERKKKGMHNNKRKSTTDGTYTYTYIPTKDKEAGKMAPQLKSLATLP